MPTLEDAILLAVDAHRGRVDKLGMPYILHPLRLMGRMSNVTEQMAALLHDVIADSDHTLESLRGLGYDDAVMDAIDHLTLRDAETFDAFIDRIKRNPAARQVKIVDLEDNMDLRRWPEIGERERERLARYRRGWEKLTQAG